MPWNVDDRCRHVNNATEVTVPTANVLYVIPRRAS